MIEMVNEFLEEPVVRQFQFWYMVFATTTVFITVALKTKLSRSPTGQNVFFLSLWFVLTMFLLAARLLKIFPDWLRGWDSVIVYTVGGTILLTRAILIWYYNMGFWVWTKAPEHEDKIEDDAK